MKTAARMKVAPTNSPSVAFEARPSQTSPSTSPPARNTCANMPAQNQATIATYPTIQDLVQEYKRSMDETVQILIHIPDEFMARKGSYWRLAYNSLEYPYHFHNHLDQMKATIDEARKN